MPRKRRSSSVKVEAPGGTKPCQIVPTIDLPPGQVSRSFKGSNGVKVVLQGDLIDQESVMDAPEDREPSPGYPSSESNASEYELKEKKGSPAKATKQAKKKKTSLSDDEPIDFPPREPALDCSVLPLPWRGRLGYACLNTVLRARRDPTFCSRTCRLDSINKMGLQFAKDLGRQNAADLSGMIEWNEHFGIRFLRVSSEMFPFASHEEHGYDLSYADAELRAAGALAMKYGHRLTAHPGQFTQIASPRPEVFTAAVRDLEMHDDLLTRLGLEGQTDRDAIMVIHLGGSYGDKEATVARFKTNYARLSERIKRRLVLENDDVCWSVEDLLPICEDLNIPLVLDWHHNNVVPGTMREGTLDVYEQYLERITQTWLRKDITPKQHYSEPREPNNPSPHKRRAHSKRVQRLPPCSHDMDLMIEAKDKEQAVFELSRIYNLQNPPLPAEIVAEGDRNGEGYYPEGQELRLKPPHLRIVKQREKEALRIEESQKPNMEQTDIEDGRQDLLSGTPVAADHATPSRRRRSKKSENNLKSDGKDKQMSVNDSSIEDGITSCVEALDADERNDDRRNASSEEKRPARRSSGRKKPGM